MNIYIFIYIYIDECQLYLSKLKRKNSKEGREK